VKNEAGKMRQALSEQGKFIWFVFVAIFRTFHNFAEKCENCKCDSGIAGDNEILTRFCEPGNGQQKT
jgi:hypothetical protein